MRNQLLDWKSVRLSLYSLQIISGSESDKSLLKKQGKLQCTENLQLQVKNKRLATLTLP